MKPHVRELLACGVLALLFLPITASAQPIHFSELSLMVRSHESESSISREVSQRKLAQKLNADQEAKLKAQGASDSLIATLRNATVSGTATQSAAVTPAERGGGTRVRNDESSALNEPAYRRSGSNVQIVDVGVGEPVNLSAWGGADREFVFSRRSITDLQSDDRTFRPNGFGFYRDAEAELTTDELTMVEPVGTFTHYQTYLGEYARGWEPNRADYTSITAHGFARPLRVQRHNPVFVEGVPYTLYPVYAAGGVSLYYVGRISEDVVRLAVVSHWR